MPRKGGTLRQMNKENPRQEIEEAIASNDLHKLLLLNGMLHGHYCPGSSMGVKAATRAMRELGVKSTGMEEVVAIVETNSCFSDGIQFVTGCSFGNNALIYRDYGKTAVTLARRTGEALRVAVKAGGSPLERYPGAAELFKKVVQERRGTEEDSEKLRHLWIDISFNMLDIPDEELFNISRLNVEVPAYARIFASVKCSVCGENVMEPRARMKEGKPVCLSCSAHEYYQLAGDGISTVTC
jgi:formylmethanofuran dehydrogenase subunit E